MALESALNRIQLCHEVKLSNGDVSTVQGYIYAINGTITYVDEYGTKYGSPSAFCKGHYLWLDDKHISTVRKRTTSSANGWDQLFYKNDTRWISLNHLRDSINRYTQPRAQTPTRLPKSRCNSAPAVPMTGQETTFGNRVIAGFFIPI
jgi:hypothetical protein